MPGQADAAAVQRIAALLPVSRTVAELVAGVQTGDIETSLTDFPDTLSDALTLVTIAIARIEKPGGGFISNAEMSDRVMDCASRLSLEWLRRQSVIAYEMGPNGIEWQGVEGCTPEFLESLRGRHETLYRFMLGLLLTRAPWRN